jgi:uroporphyrinogen III methyltransferase/synthase
MSGEAKVVYFVGAGPGNPGLLTLRAAECLTRADLIVHDRLVPAQILEYASPSAERISLTDLPGCHPEKWRHVHALIIDAVRKGKCVVRLKGGDPLLFARGGEELEALRDAGISYEVVPGVTAGVAAGAFAGIPLSHRLHASAIAFITGHEDPDKADSNLDWAELARFPGTLVIYMGIARLPQIAANLIRHGKVPTTPAAAMQWAGMGNQHTVEALLATLPDAVRQQEMKSPAIIIIGSVVNLRSKLAWFEQRPLFGKRILITRPRHQAADLARRLEELGAVTHIMPVIEIREPADWTDVDRALERLSSYQWVVFTSANGVHALIRRLRKLGRDLRALGSVGLAAIGPSTADALRQYYLEPDIVPSSFRSESLAEALAARVGGQHVLLARADRGREVLREQLSRIAGVEQIAVYSQVDADTSSEQTIQLVQSGEIDYVTLTSSNIARAFLRAIGDKGRARIRRGEVQLVSISPVTSQTVREMGMAVAEEAANFDSDGVIAALVKLAAADPRLTQLAKRIPGQIAQNAARQQSEDIDDQAQPAEGESEEHVQ